MEYKYQFMLYCSIEMRWYTILVIVIVTLYVLSTLIAIIIGYVSYKKTQKALAYAFFNKLHCGSDSCDSTIVELPIPLQNGTEYSTEVARYCADLVVRVEDSKLTPVPSGLTQIAIVNDKTKSGEGEIFGVLWTSPPSAPGMGPVLWIAYRGTNQADMQEWFQDFQYSQQGFVDFRTSQESKVHQVAMTIHKRPGMQDIGIKPPMVHGGFEAIYSQFQSTIHDVVDKIKPKQIIITGHSLGSAISQINYYDLCFSGFNPIVYNFASPLVSSTCQTVSDKSALYRHINTCDSVPNYPVSVSPDIEDPSNPYFYTQCGKALYFTLNALSISNNHTMSTYIQAFTDNLYSVPV